jgi:Endonuclease/Exonuclease/phosphatase family
VKYPQTTLLMVAALPALVTLADDFKTIDGKEYRNATVSRVEPDGIVLRSKSGIAKVYFVELPKDVQERFGYDSAALQKREESDAQTVRCTTWNLEWFPNGSAKEAPAAQQDQRIKEAADVLRPINPDIVLLQEVRDYDVCARLGEARTS